MLAECILLFSLYRVDTSMLLHTLMIMKTEMTKTREYGQVTFSLTFMGNNLIFIHQAALPGQSAV